MSPSLVLMSAIAGPIFSNSTGTWRPTRLAESVSAPSLLAGGAGADPDRVGDAVEGVADLVERLPRGQSAGGDDAAGDERTLGESAQPGDATLACLLAGVPDLGDVGLDVFESGGGFAAALECDS